MYNTGVVFGTVAMSGMGLFVIIFNGWKLNLLGLDPFSVSSFHFYVVYLFLFFFFLVSEDK